MTAEVIGRDDFSLSEKELAESGRKADRVILAQKKLITDDVEYGGAVYRTTKFPVLLPGGSYGVGAYVREITEDYAAKRREEKKGCCAIRFW
jgi:hypothetical protein